MRNIMSIFMSIVFIILFVSSIKAEVLLMEDFEDEAKYKENWTPTNGWSLQEAEIAGKKTTVLDVNGGEVGLSNKDDFGDFEIEADFRVITGYLGFIVRAQDTNNLYMIQIRIR